MPNPIQVPAGLTTDSLLGRRYVARVIDTVVIGLVVGAAIGLLSSVGPQLEPGLLRILMYLNVLVLLWIGYGALLESSPWQATLGKKVMGLRVYDAGGGRLKVWQAAGRNFVKDGSLILFELFPGGRLLSFVWLGAHLVVLHRSPVYQAIHDHASETWVAASEATTRLHIT